MHFPDPQVEHKEIGKIGQKGEIAAVTRLRITFAVGTVIQKKMRLKPYANLLWK